jgi:hypothetical protein
MHKGNHLCATSFVCNFFQEPSKGGVCDGRGKIYRASRSGAQRIHPPHTMSPAHGTTEREAKRISLGHFCSLTKAPSLSMRRCLGAFSFHVAIRRGDIAKIQLLKKKWISTNSIAIEFAQRFSAGNFRHEFSTEKYREEKNARIFYCAR